MFYSLPVHWCSKWVGALALAACLLPGLPARAELPAALEPERFEVGSGVYVRALASDPARDSMWVGTSVGALQIGLADRTPQRVLTREDGLANEFVFVIGVAPDGKVWFGTNGGGTTWWSEAGTKTFFPMHGLADYWVYAFHWDQAGDAWIGTWDGANRLDAAGTWTTYAEELINIWVYGLDSDAAGRIWFGTEGGVSMFDGSAWAAWTHQDGLGAENTANLPVSGNTGLGTRSRHDLSIYVSGRESYNPDYVFAVLVDEKDRGIWFGTWGGGASLFDGKTAWQSFTERDGLAGNIVYSIAQSPDGTLWFGTNKGVTAYDGTEFRSYDTGGGAEHIYTITIAPDGAVWAGTRGAVIRLAKPG